MTLSLTSRTRRAAQSNNLTPNLVFQIDGVDTIFGAVTILDFIQIGDPGLLIGNSWVIGGQQPLEDQESIISFDGTTTQISQKLDIDKAAGSSISQMNIALVDVNESITELISPGFLITDILARQATVWLGFGNTSFPDDYIRIFRGTIDDVKSQVGKIIFTLSHPDTKKKQEIFIKNDKLLDGAITDSQTTITLDSTTDMMTRIAGPDGSFDSSISYGIRIEDEVIFYTGISGNDLTGCTRGELGTTAAAHSDEAEVSSFHTITGTVMDLALKIMLSGWNGPYEENVEVTNFEVLGDSTMLDNAIYFDGVDVADVYGVVVGDYVTTTGATNGANNVTLKQVDQVVKTDEGSYIVVNGVTFVTETATSAVIDFRSQYDTFHPGAGLKMHNNEVDIEEHERIKRWFLSSAEYEFYIRDTVNGKEFIEQQIYFPAAAYSIPRKSKASVGYHVGPLPISDVKTFDLTNTVRASGISLRRQINRNFYNTIVYKYEEDVLEGDTFHRGHIEKDATSQTQVPIGTKALVIPAKGIREVLSGATFSSNQSERRLRRYRVGAELIEQMQVGMGMSFNVEIGDIMIVDMAALKMADTKSGTRDGAPRLFEVVDKTFDIRTGNVKLSLLDTAYGTATRYCLMSPSSRLDTGNTTTSLKLVQTGNSIFGTNEGGKWSRYIGAPIRVRSDDFTTRNDTSFITAVLGNTVTISPALSFTPQQNDTLTLDDYNSIVNNPSDTTDRIKLIYCFMTANNDNTFVVDGSMAYQMI